MTETTNCAADDAVINCTFDRDVQKARQTEEWTLLSRCVRAFTVKTAVELAVGVIAAALFALFFTLTDDEHSHFAVLAVAAAVIAAAAFTAAIADIAIARSKRKKMLPRFFDRFKQTLGAFPSPCPFSAEFTETEVTVNFGGDRTVVPLADCSGLEFDGMLAIEFGNLCGMCFDETELGTCGGEVRRALAEGGEGLRRIERSGASVRIANYEHPRAERE